MIKLRKLSIQALCLSSLALPAGAAPAQPVNVEMTVYRVTQNAAHSVGAMVKWRGMALDVKSTDFVLRAGPYKISVKNNHNFHIKNGDPIVVTGTVVKGGAAPVVEPISVVPVEVLVHKQTNWDPNVVTPQEEKEVEEWYKWICSFNRRLPQQVAGMYAATVFQYSRYYRIDPRLVLAIVGAESGFEKDAISKVGAIGLGQLMPGTAAQMGITNPRDPAQNLLGCVRYLYTEMKRWSGYPDQLPRVVASYNAGAGAVQQYNGVPPYAETKAYVVYVHSLYRELGGK